MSKSDKYIGEVTCKYIKECKNYATHDDLIDHWENGWAVEILWDNPGPYGFSVWGICPECQRNKLGRFL